MNIFKRIGRGLRRVLSSPAGAVIAIAGTAYIGIPAVTAAIDAVSGDEGGGIDDFVNAFGEKAWDQITSIGEGVSSLFEGDSEARDAGMKVATEDWSDPSESKTASNLLNEAPPFKKEEPTRIWDKKDSGDMYQKYGSGYDMGGNFTGDGLKKEKDTGIMSSVLDFIKSPGGGAVTAAALKLAGGALTPNETKMAIDAKDRWRNEDIERIRQNTNVGGLNFNAIPVITSPHARIPLPPPAPVYTPKT